MARRVVYLHSQELIDAADDLPANEGRASLVHDLVESLDLLDDAHGENGDEGLAKARVVAPRAATRDELCRFHDARFVDVLLGRTSSVSTSSSDESSGDSSDSSPEPSFGLSRRPSSSPPPRKRPKASSDALGLQDDCPLFPSLPQYTTLVAGASVTAARMLRDGEADVAISWTGGRHHAKRGEASGFCYVNDIVLAIMEMKSAPKPPPPPSSPSPSSGKVDGGASSPPPVPPLRAPPKRLSRILYLDVDLHHGDGPESAFFTTPSVLTLSIHLHAPLFFPSSGALTSTGPSNTKAAGALHALNVALEPGAGEETLKRVWGSCVEKVFGAYTPDAVVLQCGVDGLAGDPCKEWNLSLSALGACVEAALRWDKPTLLLGGGGYNSPNAARAWAYLTSVALSRPLSLSTPIPASLSSAQYALFAPDFTLDVPASFGMRDRNTEETLARVESAFGEYVDGLRGRHEAKKAQEGEKGSQSQAGTGGLAGGGEA
ncbi:hypothetical protein JCM10213_000402 [Rhodosporidiobolus nylandii]